MRQRLVLDTNVLISGLLFGGPPSRLLALVLEGAVELAISPSLIDELERVLRWKFPHAQQAIWDTVALLRELAILSLPQDTIDMIADDPSDNRVLECAISAHVDAMVSGDRHLLALKTFRGIPILTPTTFLARFIP